MSRLNRCPLFSPAPGKHLAVHPIDLPNPSCEAVKDIRTTPRTMAMVQDESISLTNPCAIGPTGRPYADWKLALASLRVLGVGRVAGPAAAVSAAAAALAAAALASAAAAAAALSSLSPPRPNMARTAARGGTAGEAQAAVRTAGARAAAGESRAAASATATHAASAASSSGVRTDAIAPAVSGRVRMGFLVPL